MTQGLLFGVRFDPFFAFPHWLERSRSKNSQRPPRAQGETAWEDFFPMRCRRLITLLCASLRIWHCGFEKSKSFTIRSDMEYRQLGNSGLRVSALSFGTGTFGGA